MVSEQRRELTRKLIGVWEDRDFLLGVNTHLKTEGNVKEMLKWLDKNNDKKLESDEVLLKAMEIRYGNKLKVNGLATRG